MRKRAIASTRPGKGRDQRMRVQDFHFILPLQQRSGTDGHRPWSHPLEVRRPVAPQIKIDHEIRKKRLEREVTCWPTTKADGTHYDVTPAKAAAQRRSRRWVPSHS